MADLIIIVGPTGSGKSTQADYIVKQHPGWYHLSSGDLLRRDPVIAQALTSGQLASNEEVDRVVNADLETHRTATMIVFDGFPRTVEQIPWLEAAMKRFNLTLRAVIKIDITREEAARRLALRHRADDNTPSIEAKWDWYEKQTLPLIAHFEEQGLLVTCNGANSVEEIGRDIDEALDA
jgi:adenylate kinase